MGFLHSLLTCISKQCDRNNNIWHRNTDFIRSLTIKTNGVKSTNNALDRCWQYEEIFTYGNFCANRIFIKFVWNMYVFDGLHFELLLRIICPNMFVFPIRASSFIDSILSFGFDCYNCIVFFFLYLCHCYNCLDWKSLSLNRTISYFSTMKMAIRFQNFWLYNVST